MLKTASALAACFLCAAAQAQSPPPIFQSWISSLQAQGYSVTQGTAYQFTSTYCQQVSQPVFKTCFANDANDPYLVAEPPVGAGYLDPYYGKQTSVTTPAGVLADQFYRLSTGEALLVIVNLPPQAAYFSYESYMFSRPITSYRRGFSKLTPDPARAEIFGSFNNSIDDVTIGKQSGLTFGQGTVAFITTANSDMAGNLVASFGAVGGNENLLFTEALGSNLNPGLGQSNDDFISIMRYTIPQDADAGSQWVNDPTGNVQVYRIDQPSFLSIKRFGSVALANKSHNTNEFSAKLDHKANLAELSGLLSQWLAGQEPGVTPTVNQTVASETVNTLGKATAGELGPYCIQHGTNCASDSQDSDDYKTFMLPSFADNRMIITDGVDHTVSNNATYHSMSVQDLTLGTGITTAAQTNPKAAGFTAGTLTGSALTVLQQLGLYSKASPALQEDLPNLFVHIFTRPCATQLIYCTQPYTSVVSDTDLNTTDAVLMLERAYVLPGFPNGANPNDLINPDVIY